MLAWNMAYNISVKCKDFKDRWKWVERGIALRHKGLEYNPADPKIYQALSWTLRHKIGQNLDDARHDLTKIHWAEQMQDILGGRSRLRRPPQPTDAGRAPEHVSKNCARFIHRPAFIQQIDKTYGPLDWRLPTPTPLLGRMGVVATAPSRTRTWAAVSPIRSCSRPAAVAAPCLRGSPTSLRRTSSFGPTWTSSPRSTPPTNGRRRKCRTRRHRAERPEESSQGGRGLAV